MPASTTSSASTASPRPTAPPRSRARGLAAARRQPGLCRRGAGRRRRGQAAPVTWIGKDPAGEHFLVGLARGGRLHRGRRGQRRGPHAGRASSPISRTAAASASTIPGLDDRLDLDATQGGWSPRPNGSASPSVRHPAPTRCCAMRATDPPRLGGQGRPAGHSRPGSRHASPGAPTSILSSRGEAAFVGRRSRPPRRGARPIRVETRGAEAPVTWRGNAVASSRPSRSPQPTRPAPATLSSAACSPRSSRCRDPTAAVEAGIARPRAAQGRASRKRRRQSA